MRFHPGDRVDHYTLIEPLGEGGQGAVWKVLDPRDGGVVRALKLVALSETGAAGFERARREARILATAQHPALVAGHGLFEDPRAGIVGLIMDLVPGRNLAEVLAEGGLHRGHALAVLAQVADALAYIHEAGLTHRDLKPENVILTDGFREAPHRQGSVKLVDFGIAAPARNAGGLTGTGLVIGTLPYLSPELVDPATWGPAGGSTRDLFAFGVMAHQLLCGGHPTGLGPHATMIDYARAYKAAEVGRIAWPPPTLTGASGAAVAACLALRPAQRPANGAGLVALLRAAPGRQIAPARDLSSTTAPHLAVTGPMSTPPVSAPPPSRTAPSAGPASIAARTMPMPPSRAAALSEAPEQRGGAWRLGAVFVGATLAAGVLAAWGSGWLGDSSNEPVDPTTTVPAPLPTAAPTPAPMQRPSPVEPTGLKACYIGAAPHENTTRAQCSPCEGTPSLIQHGASFRMRVLSVLGPPSIPTKATELLCVSVTGSSQRERCVPYQKYPLPPLDSERLQVTIEDIERGRVSFIKRARDGTESSPQRDAKTSGVRVNALCQGLILRIKDERGSEVKISVYLDDH